MLPRVSAVNLEKLTAHACGLPARKFAQVRIT
jgi:hypothetical protein